MAQRTKLHHSPETAAKPSSEPASRPETTASVSSIKGAGIRNSLFGTREEIATLNAHKSAVVSDARQKLAEAYDIYSLANGNVEAANESAAEAGLAIFGLRKSGELSADEAGAILGDVFGYKVKGKLQVGATPTTKGVPKDYSQNGQTASKTPFGQGEAIRKRIVRAMQAHEYVTDGDGGQFFKGLPEDEVSAVLTGMEIGDIGFWKAYQDFGDIKSKNTDRVSPAFNPKHIASLFEALSEESAVEVLAKSPDLRVAYDSLFEIVGIIGDAILAGEAEKKAA